MCVVYEWVGYWGVQILKSLARVVVEIRCFIYKNGSFQLAAQNTIQALLYCTTRLFHHVEQRRQQQQQ